MEMKLRDMKIRELSAMYGIARLLSTKMNIRELLDEILKMLADKMGMQRGMITLHYKDLHEVKLDIAPELDINASKEIKYMIGEGITGKVIETGRPMAIQKLDEEPLFLDKTGIRKEIDRSKLAFMCVPIKHGDDVIGALSVDTVAGETSQLNDEVEFLSAVADVIAQSVDARRKEQEERDKLELENLMLRQQIEHQAKRPRNIIGNSKGMNEVYSLIEQVEDSNTTVLITGETGTGKELAAAAIHLGSPRSGGPFIRVNCSALPENLLENELFGHEKGAYTGAVDRHIGRFEQANSGTIFLDEIAEIPMSAQVKLLRILQEREFERVGGSQSIKVNVRVIAATNRDLELSMEKGQFRTDLFYRLNVFPIHMPPLRDRGADILLLADYFVQKYSKELNKPVNRICTPAINALMAYHWPGNVRELENCIERAVLLTKDNVIHAYTLPPTLQLRSKELEKVKGGTLEKMVAAYERELIEEAVKYAFGNQSEAARRLGTTKRVIQYKVEKYEIDCNKYKSRKTLTTIPSNDIGEHDNS